MRVRILKCILTATGSQRRDRSMGADGTVGPGE